MEGKEKVQAVLEYRIKAYSREVAGQPAAAILSEEKRFWGTGTNGREWLLLELTEPALLTTLKISNKSVNEMEVLGAMNDTPEGFTRILNRYDVPRRDVLLPFNYVPVRFLKLVCVKGMPVALWAVQVLGVAVPGYTDRLLPLLAYVRPRISTSDGTSSSESLSLLRDVAAKAGHLAAFLEPELAALPGDDPSGALEFLREIAGPLAPLVAHADGRLWADAAKWAQAALPAPALADLLELPDVCALATDSPDAEPAGPDTVVLLDLVSEANHFLGLLRLLSRHPPLLDVARRAASAAAADGDSGRKVAAYGLLVAACCHESWAACLAEAGKGVAFEGPLLPCLAPAFAEGLGTKVPTTVLTGDIVTNLRSRPPGPRLAHALGLALSAPPPARLSAALTPALHSESAAARHAGLRVLGLALAGPLRPFQAQVAQRATLAVDVVLECWPAADVAPGATAAGRPASEACVLLLQLAVTGLLDPHSGTILAAGGSAVLATALLAPHLRTALHARDPRHPVLTALREAVRRQDVLPALEAQLVAGAAPAAVAAVLWPDGVAVPDGCFESATPEASPQAVAFAVQFEQLADQLHAGGGEAQSAAAVDALLLAAACHLAGPPPSGVGDVRAVAARWETASPAVPLLVKAARWELAGEGPGVDAAAPGTAEDEEAGNLDPPTLARRHSSALLQLAVRRLGSGVAGPRGAALLTALGCAVRHGPADLDPSTVIQALVGCVRCVAEAAEGLVGRPDETAKAAAKGGAARPERRERLPALSPAPTTLWLLDVPLSWQRLQALLRQFTAGDVHRRLPPHAWFRLLPTVASEPRPLVRAVVWHGVAHAFGRHVQAAAVPDLRLWTALLVVFVDDLILDWAHGQRTQPLDPVDMEGERDGSAAGSAGEPSLLAAVYPEVAPVVPLRQLTAEFAADACRILMAVLHQLSTCPAEDAPRVGHWLVQFAAQGVEAAGEKPTGPAATMDTAVVLGLRRGVFGRVVFSLLHRYLSHFADCVAAEGPQLVGVLLALCRHPLAELALLERVLHVLQPLLAAPGGSKTPLVPHGKLLDRITTTETTQRSPSDLLLVLTCQLLPTFDPDKQRQLLRHLPRWLPLADAPGPVADRLRAWALALAAPGVTAAPDLLAPLVPPLLAELEQYWDAHTALCHALLDALVAAEPPPGPSASPLSLVPALERLVADRQWRVAAALTARLLARDPAAASAAEGDGHPAAVLASSAVQRAQRAPRLPWRLEAVAQFHRLCVSLLAAPGSAAGRDVISAHCCTLLALSEPEVRRAALALLLDVFAAPPAPDAAAGTLPGAVAAGVWAAVCHAAADVCSELRDVALQVLSRLLAYLPAEGAADPAAHFAPLHRAACAALCDAEAADAMAPDGQRLLWLLARAVARWPAVARHVSPELWTAIGHRATVLGRLPDTDAGPGGCAADLALDAAPMDPQGITSNAALCAALLAVQDGLESDLQTALHCTALAELLEAGDQPRPAVAARPLRPGDVAAEVLRRLNEAGAKDAPDHQAELQHSVDEARMELALLRAEGAETEADLEEVWGALQAAAEAERGDLERQLAALREQLRQEHRRLRLKEVQQKRAIAKQYEAARLAEFERYQALESEQLQHLMQLQHSHALKELERQRELEKERDSARAAKFKLEVQRERSRRQDADSRYSVQSSKRDRDRERERERDPKAERGGKGERDWDPEVDRPERGEKADKDRGREEWLEGEEGEAAESNVGPEGGAQDTRPPGSSPTEEFWASKTGVKSIRRRWR